LAFSLQHSVQKYGTLGDDGIDAGSKMAKIARDLENRADQGACHKQDRTFGAGEHTGRWIPN
jgi:hypothetical protein